ncbi:hypothetical protein HMPREF3226_02193 [Prevotella corporis]|uniref:Uncharacterized protein n=1 Tax=Prevotella corporis TaxID=28128 RepID=A0A133PXI5_9BACT|nr:hypothetical protein HMPREF3226_02193 [Prevotella corporis]
MIFRAARGGVSVVYIVVFIYDFSIFHSLKSNGRAYVHAPQTIALSVTIRHLTPPASIELQLPRLATPFFAYMS